MKNGRIWPNWTRKGTSYKLCSGTGGYEQSVNEKYWFFSPKGMESSGLLGMLK